MRIFWILFSTGAMLITSLGEPPNNLNRSYTQIEAQKPWQHCCWNDLHSTESNYIWPIKSGERNMATYNFMTKLVYTAASSKLFRIVEPFLRNNKVDFDGEPLSMFLNIEKLNEDSEVMVSRRRWKLAYGYEEQRNAEELVKQHAYILETTLLKDIGSLPCKVSNGGHHQHCFQLETTTKGKVVRVATTKENGVRVLSDTFAFIRYYSAVGKSSAWGRKHNVTDFTPITLGLEGGWYNQFTIQHIWPNDVSHGAHVVEPRFQISRYLSDISDKILRGLKVDAVMGWRVQRQFASTPGVQNDITRNHDEGGYVVGCEVDHLLASLEQFRGSRVVALMDIYADGGKGCDGKDAGPTQSVRKSIVRSLRSHFSSLMVLEALAYNSHDRFLAMLDPLGLHRSDRETFETWLEIAIGVRSDVFIDGGGHFARLITLLRLGNNVVKIPVPPQCTINDGANTRNDDVSNTLWTA